MELPKVPKWILRYGRNFYVMSSLAFLVWMALFDGNDFVSQFRNWRRLQEAYAELAYYDEKIEEVEQDRAELLSDPKRLEKFAREKYLMKKPNEDLYLLVEE
jgi:cell division protein FtsB